MKTERSSSLYRQAVQETPAAKKDYLTRARALAEALGD